MPAIIIPIERPAANHPPMTLKRLVESLPQIEKTIQWLLKHQVCILGFGCSRRGPMVTVAAHPVVYMLAKGSAESLGHEQRGALRHETWSFFSGDNVEILWEEVVCVH